MTEIGFENLQCLSVGICCNEIRRPSELCGGPIAMNMDISVIRSREDNETRQMAVSPALVVVLDVFFDDVSTKDHEESEPKQMAAMPDLVLI